LTFLSQIRVDFITVKLNISKSYWNKGLTQILQAYVQLKTDFCITLERNCVKI